MLPRASGFSPSPSLEKGVPQERPSGPAVDGQSPAVTTVRHWSMLTAGGASCQKVMATTKRLSIKHRLLPLAVSGMLLVICNGQWSVLTGAALSVRCCTGDIFGEGHRNSPPPPF